MQHHMQRGEPLKARAEQTDELHVFESARIDELPITFPHCVRLLRQQLARRYILVRLLLWAGAGLWFSTGVLQLSMGPGRVVRIAVLVPLLCLWILLVACSFPTQLTSPAGQRLMQPICATCAFGAMRMGYIGLMYHCPPVSATITALYTLNVFVVTTAWSTLALLAYCGRGSWLVLRSVFMVDGLSFMLTTLTLRLLNNPDLYPPLANPLPFWIAFFRGFLTFLLGLLPTPDVRSWLAARANSAGWNHVALPLQNAGSRDESEPIEAGLTAVTQGPVTPTGAALTSASSAADNLSEISCSGDSGACSHHTARCDAQIIVAQVIPPASSDATNAAPNQMCTNSFTVSPCDGSDQRAGVIHAGTIHARPSHARHRQ